MARIVTTRRKRNANSHTLSRKALVFAFAFLAVAAIFGVVWSFLQKRDTAPEIIVAGDSNVISEPQITVAELPKAQTGDKPDTQASNIEVASDPRQEDADYTASDSDLTKENSDLRIPDSELSLSPPPYRHQAEQLLSMIVSGSDGTTEMPPIPLPQTYANPTNDEQIAQNEAAEMLAEDLFNSMTNLIVIYEDESLKMQTHKEIVADMKIQLSKIVKGGGNVADALREYVHSVNEGVYIRKEIIAEIDKIEDDEEALAYIEEINSALLKEDIPAITLEDAGFIDPNAPQSNNPNPDL